MIDKKISVSEQVACIPLESQLVFTWGIPHADDIGLLPHSYRTLKALIVPMWDCSLEDFTNYVDKIVESGLWKEVEYNGDKFYLFSKFREHQTLKRDRQPVTLLNIPLNKSFAVSWKTVGEVLETFGIQLEDNGFQLETEENRTEPNRTEKDSSKKTKKKSTSTKFVKPTLKEVEEYCKERKNNVNPSRFLDYYESKGWVVGKSPMKSWKAAIRTWEKNTFGSANNVLKAKDDKYDKFEGQ